LSKKAVLVYPLTKKCNETPAMLKMAAAVLLCFTRAVRTPAAVGVVGQARASSFGSGSDERDSGKSM